MKQHKSTQIGQIKVLERAMWKSSLMKHVKRFRVRLHAKTHTRGITSSSSDVCPAPLTHIDDTLVPINALRSIATLPPYPLCRPIFPGEGKRTKTDLSSLTEADYEICRRSTWNVKSFLEYDRCKIVQEKIVLQ